MKYPVVGQFSSLSHLLKLFFFNKRKISKVFIENIDYK